MRDSVLKIRMPLLVAAMTQVPSWLKPMASIGDLALGKARTDIVAAPDKSSKSCNDVGSYENELVRKRFVKLVRDSKGHHA